MISSEIELILTELSKTCSEITFSTLAHSRHLVESSLMKNIKIKNFSNKNFEGIKCNTICRRKLAIQLAQTKTAKIIANF